MKSNYFKRMATLILAAVIATVPLAGCGKNEKAASDSTTGDSTVASTASATAEPKIHKLKVMGPESGNTHVKFADREKYLAWQELDKWFKDAGLDIEFEIIASDQYEVIIQTRMASASGLPDFCNINPLDVATCLNLADKKIILPINEIIDKYSDGTSRDFFNGKAAFARKSTTASDGNRYWTPSVQITTFASKPASTCMPVVIRNDWLEKLNLPVPATAEEFASTIKAFQDKDANGNKMKDEIYGTVTTEFASGISNWFGLPGSRFSIDLNAGKIVTPWYMDGVKDYFTFMNRLIKDGLLEETLIGAKSGVLDQMIAENKVASMYTYALQNWYEASVVGVTDAYYRPLAPLKAVDGVTPISYIEPPELAWSKFAVTNACKDLEGMAKFLDIIYSDRFAALSAWGIEGTTFEKKDNIEVFKIDSNNWEECAKTGNCPGEFMWENAMFPKLRFAPMESEINAIGGIKKQYQEEVINYTPAMPNDTAPYLAVPTVEEQERLAELETNYKTYSKELAADLMLGNRSIKDWDSYIEQMKKLGLDEILAIYQARYDRFMKN